NSRFGFLGPNGAGKTTTIRILMGLLRASAGSGRILEQDVWRDGPKIRRQVGYLPGEVRFYDGLTGRATLAFLDAARGGKSRDEINRLTRRFDLDLDKRVRAYSRGMKQKLGLIQALMHRPQLLILDEPTVSLDPLIREVLYEELHDVTADGRTVLFSSHTLSEVQELCDVVAILRDGRLIEQERIDVLRRRAIRRVEVALRPGRSVSDTPSQLQVISRTDATLKGTWTGPIDPLLAWLSKNAVQDVSIAPPDLEDLFLAYYADDQPSAATAGEAGGQP
ncbi:MAG: ABC transporter ATP-binding protein, partial [Planctomycetes bacterium]|nr:ABC transporter ATP-binding protein [Planctomycetota bacterium]